MHNQSAHRWQWDEFKRQVKDYSKSRKIKMINCRPYNTKAEGKVGHSQHSLRQKIYYDLKKKKETGINWV